jgi:hypothetical protein
MCTLFAAHRCIVLPPKALHVGSVCMLRCSKLAVSLADQLRHAQTGGTSQRSSFLCSQLLNTSDCLLLLLVHALCLLLSQCCSFTEFCFVCLAQLCEPGLVLLRQLRVAASRRRLRSLQLLCMPAVQQTLALAGWQASLTQSTQCVLSLLRTAMEAGVRVCRR